MLPNSNTQGEKRSDRALDPTAGPSTDKVGVAVVPPQLGEQSLPQLKPEAQKSRAPSPEESSDNKEPRTKEKDKLKAVNALEEPLVPTQLKIMDITPSLINFHSRGFYA